MQTTLVEWRFLTMQTTLGELSRSTMQTFPPNSLDQKRSVHKKLRSSFICSLRKHLNREKTDPSSPSFSSANELRV